MKPTSEKELYVRQMEAISSWFQAEYFVWGEELIDKKLIVYPKKLKQIAGYEEIKKNLRPCGVVVVNTRKKYDPLRCILATLDTKDGNIYFAEGSFNSVWKRLRHSVNLGIRLAKERGMPCDIHRPEDILVLEHLRKEGKAAYIKDNEIHYRGRELTDEERQNLSRRQRLLDNPGMNYYFSVHDKYYHDKDCLVLKEVPSALFGASADLPVDKEICPKCRRKLYLRKACAPNTKQIPVCDRIFKNRWVGVDSIMHYVTEAGMKFHATSLDVMEVESGEDRWVIRGLDTGYLSLWHNNYVKTSEKERYITDGFHDQNVRSKSLTQLLQYIEGYTWEKHLQGEAFKSEQDWNGQSETAGESLQDKMTPETEEPERLSDGAGGKTEVWYRRLLRKIRLWVMR